jgi:hypothetical protein
MPWPNLAGDNRDKYYQFTVSGRGQAKAALSRKGETQRELNPWKDNIRG